MKLFKPAIAEILRKTSIWKHTSVSMACYYFPKATKEMAISEKWQFLDINGLLDNNIHPATVFSLIFSFSEREGLYNLIY